MGFVADWIWMQEVGAKGDMSSTKIRHMRRDQIRAKRYIGTDRFLFFFSLIK